MRGSQHRRTAMIGLGAALAAAAVGACRDEERGTSGQSWICTCVLEPDGADVELHVCAASAGEAAAVAEPCAESATDSAARFCDCVESSTQFCEPGECLVRRRL